MVNKSKIVNRGLFVVFEGIHGCGKSTQVELLYKRLMEDRFSVVVTKEVKDTPLAEEIYRVAFQDGSEAFENSLIMTLLIAASRASRVNKLIKPALMENKIVIGDRYEGSMLIYQYFCQGVNYRFVRKLNEYVTNGIHADITFVLDVDPRVAHTRRVLRIGFQRKLSGWDAKDEKFHRRSRIGYLTFAKSEPGWILIDGTRLPEEIASEIYSKTTNLIKLKNEQRDT